MKELIYIAAAIIIEYVGRMIANNKGVPTSISDTYYITNSYLFTAVMVSVAGLFFFGAMPITADGYEFLVFLTSAGLTMVGAACHCRDPFDIPTHYAGALCFALSSQAWCAIVASPFVLLTFVSASAYLWSKNRIFWAEINCVINILLATIIA